MGIDTAPVAPFTDCTGDAAAATAPTDWPLILLTTQFGYVPVRSPEQDPDVGPVPACAPPITVVPPDAFDVCAANGSAKSRTKPASALTAAPWRT